MILLTISAIVIVVNLALAGCAASETGKTPQAVSPAEAGPRVPVSSWMDLVEETGTDPALTSVKNSIVTQAGLIGGRPIVRRVYRLADVGQFRTSLDPRVAALEPEIREQFALAISDSSSAGLTDELQYLAAAFLLTGQDLYRKRIVVQLEEMASWSPLQRPGWTLYEPGRRLPADGKDGSWLATGTGIRAIATALEMLPEESIPTELRAKLEVLLRAEIKGIVEDWKRKRQWFVSSNNAVTNQWVLPTEGLILACLVVGKEKERSAYELGITNMLAALDSHGAAGEFEEGIAYASMTMTSMLYAAHAAAVHGDRRLIDHPFLQNAPTWLVHHMQPGRRLINAFDAYGATILTRAGTGYSSLHHLLALFSVCTGSEVARWAISNLFLAPPATLSGYLFKAMPPTDAASAPSTFAAYERATRVNWRESWDDTGTGVWVRGGHRVDQHDHIDRGHVNLIVDGKPILIESGTPGYGTTKLHSHYSSGMGHNVLQLGLAVPEPPYPTSRPLSLPGWQKAKSVAPITVHALDASGGDVSVDCTAGYDGLSLWRRDVEWSASHLDVTDTVELAEGKTHIVLFRWHLGTAADVELSGENNEWVAKLHDAVITITCSSPVEITQVKLPDATISAPAWTDTAPSQVNTTLVVQSTSPVEELAMTTRVRW